MPRHICRGHGLSTTTPELPLVRVAGASNRATSIVVPTLQDILSADPDAFVAGCPDIAAINLACAVGLPKAEGLDVAACLRRLDAMAAWVRVKTAKSWHHYEHKPSEFRHSKSVFRVMLMLHFLHKQFGVHYNPARRGGHEPDWGDAGDHFIHGVLGERKTGTCASLPVFAVAVGRRLGYPLKLVKAPEHLLFRWDDGSERFNVEYNGEGGEVRRDGYYRAWPVRWDAKLYAENDKHRVWLTPLTPRQEVAKCLETRVIVLDSLGRCEEAVECLDAAERFNPTNPYYHGMRLDLFSRLGGAEGLPGLNPAPVGRRGTRPNFIISPLFTLARRQPEWCQWSYSERPPGPGLRVPLTAVVSSGPMFSANWYWNFVKDHPLAERVEPGVELLDVADPFRDRSKDASRLSVRITKTWGGDEAPLHVHDLRLIRPSQRRSVAHGQHGP